jgi:hypothetical protein
MTPANNTRENREATYELKFMVPSARAEDIRAWARDTLLPDPHADPLYGDAYRITSLYFDTGEFDVFRRNGSYGRAKYRIRRYNHAETVFVERKLKTRGIVTKRRTIVPVEELKRLCDLEADHRWGGNWFQKRMLVRQLRPVCQISYMRTARVLPGLHGLIRLTIDDGLQAVPIALPAFQDHAASEALLPGQCIIELKYQVELPPQFKLLIQSFTLTPSAVSKYRVAVSGMGLAGPEDKIVRIEDAIHKLSTPPSSSPAESTSQASLPG